MQHLKSDRPTHLCEYLDRPSPLRVCLAAEGMPLETGTAYVGVPGQHLRLLERRRYQRANSYYSALQRVQSLLGVVRRRSEELQRSAEEMEASNEELQTTTEEMEASSSYLRTLMDSMTNILMATDPAGVITDVNPTR